MAGEIHNIRQGRSGSYPSEGSPRRLAAILAADISGYSRLMAIDEEGTHARVKRHRRELIEPTVAEHHGRIVKNTGDGFLAIFDSPVEAVRCAIVIQQSMVGRNAALPREQWILYRIGVNLGDVIVEPDDVYGDGVNIAARLEGIANPGDLYISGGVYEQIKHKLVCGYQSLGDRQVKNITEPISVYRVLPDPDAVIKARPTRGLAVAVVLCVSLIASLFTAATVWYLFVWQPRQLVAPLQPSPAQTPNAAKSTSAASQTATPTKPEAGPSAGARTTPQVAVVPPASPSALQPVIEPEMVTLPGGKFEMGSNDDASERPIHQVNVKPFAIGKFPVTVRQWNQCVAANACAYRPTGKDDAPVSNVSWTDTQQFTEWLSRVTQKKYRLPSEAEWEYAARGSKQTKYWWGDQLQSGMANCNGCNEAYDATQPLMVGSFKPNPFGLYDMGGGVDQWVADCWHKNYQAAPADGSAWMDADCSAHVIRSGSWKNDPSYVRPASRDRYDTNVRYPTHGFRVAYSL
ncbi:MAG TPA: SUMF1/EgtB/PvdO family nonheme iron enzyme [Pseudolabrys sp.]|nr:SUMF1/EgtB/PvdO family nonheme iron enzyme [Pseudolabrys sp.]